MYKTYYKNLSIADAPSYFRVELRDGIQIVKKYSPNFSIRTRDLGKSRDHEKLTEKQWKPMNKGRSIDILNIFVQFMSLN